MSLLIIHISHDLFFTLCFQFQRLSRAIRLCFIMIYTRWWQTGGGDEAADLFALSRRIARH